MSYEKFTLALTHWCELSGFMPGQSLLNKCLRRQMFPAFHKMKLPLAYTQSFSSSLVQAGTTKKRIIAWQSVWDSFESTFFLTGIKTFSYVP